MIENKTGENNIGAKGLKSIAPELKGMKALTLLDISILFTI